MKFMMLASHLHGYFNFSFLFWFLSMSCLSFGTFEGFELESFTNKPKFRCSSQTPDHEDCPSKLCFDSINVKNDKIETGCVTGTELCLTAGCALNKNEFVCCCAHPYCNGKSHQMIKARWRMFQNGDYRQRLSSGGDTVKRALSPEDIAQQPSLAETTELPKGTMTILPIHTEKELKTKSAENNTKPGVTQQQHHRTSKITAKGQPITTTPSPPMTQKKKQTQKPKAKPTTKRSNTPKSAVKTIPTSTIITTINTEQNLAISPIFNQTSATSALPKSISTTALNQADQNKSAILEQSSTPINRQSESVNSSYQKTSVVTNLVATSNAPFSPEPLTTLMGSTTAKENISSPTLTSTTVPQTDMTTTTSTTTLSTESPKKISMNLTSKISTVKVNASSGDVMLPHIIQKGIKDNSKHQSFQAEEIPQTTAIPRSITFSTKMNPLPQYTESEAPMLNLQLTTKNFNNPQESTSMATVAQSRHEFFASTTTLKQAEQQTSKQQAEVHKDRITTYRTTRSPGNRQPTKAKNSNNQEQTGITTPFPWYFIAFGGFLTSVVIFVLVCGCLRGFRRLCSGNSMRTRLDENFEEQAIPNGTVPSSQGEDKMRRKEKPKSKKMKTATALIAKENGTTKESLISQSTTITTMTTLDGMIDSRNNEDVGNELTVIDPLLGQKWSGTLSNAKAH